MEVVRVDRLHPASIQYSVNPAVTRTFDILHVLLSKRADLEPTSTVSGSRLRYPSSQYTSPSTLTK